MVIPLKKLYYLGIGIYIFSFFLPVYSSQYGGKFYGYNAAAMLLSGLLEWEGFVAYICLILTNSANIVMLLNFILLFKFKLRQLLFLQIFALLSSMFWIFNSPFSGDFSFADREIGYWNWMFGILLVTMVMLKDFINHLRMTEKSR